MDEVKFTTKLFSGGLAGIIGTATIFPIDLVKTRLQNYKGQDRISGYGLVKNILKNEGPRGLYRGLMANLIGVTPEKAIKLAANDYFRGVMSKYSSKKVDDLPPYLGMLAGAFAGLAQVIATNPMESVKIQMQIATAAATSSNTATLHNPPSTISVIRSLGFRGLYRGSSATLMRDIPFSMIFFQLFASLKKYGSEQNNGKPVEFHTIFVSGILAGAIGAFLVTPMDVVKTRYQSNQSSRSIFSIYKSIWMNEGVTAFFKGSLQRCFIVAPLFGISLTVYEIQQSFLRK